MRAQLISSLTRVSKRFIAQSREGVYPYLLSNPDRAVLAGDEWVRAFPLGYGMRSILEVIALLYCALSLFCLFVCFGCFVCGFLFASGATVNVTYRLRDATPTLPPSLSHRSFRSQAHAPDENNVTRVGVRDLMAGFLIVELQADVLLTDVSRFLEQLVELSYV